MSEKLNENSEQRARLWEHRLHVETLFYSRLNFFLVFESVLLGVIGALYSKSGSPIWILKMLGFLGLLITAVWLFVQMRHEHIFTTIDNRVRRHEDAFPEYGATMKDIGTWPIKEWKLLGKNPAIRLLAYLVPILVIIVWGILLIFLFLLTS